MLEVLFDFISGGAKTRIYRTYLGWLLILHADILFIMFLIDQTLIYKQRTMLKGEYLISYFFSFGEWSILLEILRILLAAGLTYLMIWTIPKIFSERSYKEELKVEYALRKMKIEKDEELNKKENQLVDDESLRVQKESRVLNEKLKNLQAERKVLTEKAKIEESPTERRWDAEYEEFRKHRLSLQTLKDIKHTVYAEAGNLYQYMNASGWAQHPKGINSENLALADTNGLIQLNDKGKSISLTEKGKYFIRKL